MEHSEAQSESSEYVHKTTGVFTNSWRIKIALGSYFEIPLEYEQISKEGGGFWDDVNGGYLSEDLVLAAIREEIEWVHAEGVYETVPMPDCVHAGQSFPKWWHSGHGWHSS